jgi:RHS repeat-associated protein
MKLNQIALSLALSLVALSGIVAKETEKVPGVAAQPASYFYTGKPYDADLGTYTYNYRNYDPASARWTTADPSGFPDGANNQVYGPVPTTQVDCQGLFAITGNTTGSPQNNAPNINVNINTVTGVGSISGSQLSSLKALYQHINWGGYAE